MSDNKTPRHFNFEVARGSSKFVHITLSETHIDIDTRQEITKILTILPFLLIGASASICNRFVATMSKNYEMSQLQAQRIYEDSIKDSVQKLRELKA